MGRPVTLTVESAILGQRVVINDPGNGWISATCDDGTVYRPQELNMIRLAGELIDPEVHLVKKLFTGTITAIGEYTPYAKYLKRKEEEDRERTSSSSDSEHSNE